MTILPGQTVVYTGPAEQRGPGLGDRGSVLDIDFANHTASVMWASGPLARQACAVYDYYLAQDRQQSITPTAVAHLADTSLIADSLEGPPVTGLTVRAAYDRGGAEEAVGSLYDAGAAPVVARRVQDALEGVVASLRTDAGFQQALDGLDVNEIDGVIRHATLNAVESYLQEESDVD